MKDKAVLLYDLNSGKFCACLVSDWRVIESGTKINGSVWCPPDITDPKKPGKYYPIDAARPIEDLNKIISARDRSQNGYPSYAVLAIYGRPYIRDTNKIVQATGDFASSLFEKQIQLKASA